MKNHIVDGHVPTSVTDSTTVTTLLGSKLLIRKLADVSLRTLKHIRARSFPEIVLIELLATNLKKYLAV